ncbi:DUF1223 domain-containing protein [Aureimonas populi]|uniref:DUF1223 domain-containing protein n=1 Tax=Aureimonas populi TaxID=1701758 RepID=A0ABW5CMZ0_9HYPH|nr:DUF1223 domain-containing protein [Aureimonas populi]
MTRQPDLSPAHSAPCAISRRRVLALVALSTLALPARAEMVGTSEQVSGVVELFTSQGCASCPPADKVLSALAERDDILALSYHVDYWDYIGWKDAFGSRENTERQRAYGKALAVRSIYTPQMIVNGVAEVAGPHEAVVDAAIRDTRPRDTASVRLTLNDRMLQVRAEGRPTTDSPGMEPVLVLVTFRNETMTNVGRGENQGRQLKNSHSVRYFRVLGALADRPLDIEMPVSMLADPDGGATGCAAFVQMMGEGGEPGPIIAAAQLTLTP